MSDITILGGGLVGPVLALQLAQKDYSIDLFDRGSFESSLDDKSGRAINITLCTRGLNALKEIGLASEILSCAVPVYGRIVHQKDGSMNFAPYGQKREALYAICRNDLRNLLLKGLARQTKIRLHPQTKCVGLDFDAKSFAITDPNESRQTIEYELLLGADGANSAVRKALESKRLVQSQIHFHDTAYRELNLPAQTVTFLKLEREAIHVWPRGRKLLLSFPNIDGSMTLSLHLPVHGPGYSYENIESAENLLALFKEEFPDLGQVIAPQQADDVLRARTGKMVTVKCSTWSYAGEVLLVGDAAHSIIPSYGQGANAGFEDCRVLAKSLEGKGADYDQALRNFETARKPDMDLMADLCYDHLQLLKAGLGDSQTLLRHKIEQYLYTRMSGLHSLYYNISFTELSYREAYEKSLVFEQYVTQIARQIGPTTLESMEGLEKEIRQAMERTSHQIPREMWTPITPGVRETASSSSHRKASI